MEEQQRVAVIIGAANGLGREFARAMAARSPDGRPRHRRRERHGGRRVRTAPSAGGLDKRGVGARGLASELGPHEITINAIAPGLTRTETAIRTNGANGGFERAIARQLVPVTEEPVNLVSIPLYVCDEGSRFLAGQTIVVDGGSVKR